MALKLFRFKHLKDHTNSAGRHAADPFTTAIKDHVLSTKFGGSTDKICPVFLLPLLIIVIFVFTIAQILLIHRTIEAYKLRDQAYRDCYYPNESGALNKNGTNSTVAAVNVNTGSLTTEQIAFNLSSSSSSSLGSSSSSVHRSSSSSSSRNLTSTTSTSTSINHKPLVLPKANYD